MKRNTVISLAIVGAVATGPAASAEILEYDTAPSSLQADLSANEQIVADAWKSPMHEFKAAALEGIPLR
jgi:hypothetical protein